MSTTFKALSQIVFFSPSGALIDEALFDQAILQLKALGFSTQETLGTRLREQRFAGTNSERIGGIQQAVQTQTPSVLMATRGGYGLSRLLPELDFVELASKLNQGGHLLCGHSDVTSLQLALLGAGATPASLLHGPLACFDFGAQEGVNPQTQEHFMRAVKHGKVDIEWPALCMGLPAAADGTHVINGPVWGGNLTLLCSLLGTPWMPKLPGGILVLEDVNEPAYKIERMLLQLLHAGVLAQQQAIVLGNFCEPAPSTHDNGFTLQTAAGFVQAKVGIPVLMHFPFGHCTPKACWFQGANGKLSIDGQNGARLEQCIAA